MSKIVQRNPLARVSGKHFLYDLVVHRSRIARTEFHRNRSSRLGEFSDTHGHTDKINVYIYVVYEIQYNTIMIN